MNEAARLFHEHHLSIFRYLRRMVGETETAEELTQEVFLRVVRALPNYRAEGHERAWLFSIARNALFNRNRGQRRKPAEDSYENEPPVLSFDRSTERIGLERALSDLTRVDRDAFLLREMAGLGYAEIASVCEITPDAVRSRISRARKALREKLSAGPSSRSFGRRKGKKS